MVILRSFFVMWEKKLDFFEYVFLVICNGNVFFYGDEIKLWIYLVLVLWIIKCVNIDRVVYYGDNWFSFLLLKICDLFYCWLDYYGGCLNGNFVCFYVNFEGVV